MLKKIDHKTMGENEIDWLKTIFHFSFSNYYNPENMNFGVLRVLNDDLIGAHRGFNMHPHRDMEIITYVVDGELTHSDSVGNTNTTKSGDIQYMSAGTGVNHSEHNRGDQILRSLQIWILPDKKGHNPQYGDYHFEWDDRKDKWLHMISGMDGTAPVKINQDVNFYVSVISKDRPLAFNIEKGRAAYLVLIDGASDINGVSLNTRDAMEIIEESITIHPSELSHILIIEMKKPTD